MVIIFPWESERIIFENYTVTNNYYIIICYPKIICLQTSRILLNITEIKSEWHDISGQLLSNYSFLTILVSLFVNSFSDRRPSWYHPTPEFRINTN